MNVYNISVLIYARRESNSIQQQVTDRMNGSDSFQRAVPPIAARTAAGLFCTQSRSRGGLAAMYPKR